MLQSFEICKQISPVPCLAVSSGQIHGKAQVGVEAPDQACSCIGDRPVEFHLLNIPLFYLFYLLKNCLLKVINIHSLFGSANSTNIELYLVAGKPVTA